MTTRQRKVVAAGKPEPERRPGEDAPSTRTIPKNILKMPVFDGANFESFVLNYKRRRKEPSMPCFVCKVYMGSFPVRSKSFYIGDPLSIDDESDTPVNKMDSEVESGMLAAKGKEMKKQAVARGARGTWLGGQVTNVMNGEWGCEILWQEGVPVGLVMYHLKYMKKGSLYNGDYHELGLVDIDTATLCVLDVENGEANRDNLAELGCGVGKDELYPYGASVFTGGDGMFPVQVLTEDDGEIIALRVRFLNDERRIPVWRMHVGPGDLRRSTNTNLLLAPVRLYRQGKALLTGRISVPPVDFPKQLEPFADRATFTESVEVFNKALPTPWERRSLAWLRIMQESLLFGAIGIPMLALCSIGWLVFGFGTESLLFNMCVYIMCFALIMLLMSLATPVAVIHSSLEKKVTSRIEIALNGAEDNGDSPLTYGVDMRAFQKFGIITLRVYLDATYVGGT